MTDPGHVFWLFGLSGAGKSTLATALQEKLWSEHAVRALMLDGDRCRAGLCAGLGFSNGDRTENLRRAAQVARLGVESGLLVIASFITPLEDHRRLVLSVIGADHLDLVHVRAPVELCRQRDVKGLYARAIRGTVAHMTGVTAEFEEPRESVLTLDTSTWSAEDCRDLLLRRVRERAGAQLATTP